jgi:hypothetical protein
MIDNPAPVGRSIERLHGYLPLPAFPTQGDRSNAATRRSEGQQRACPVHQARVLCR